MKNISFNILKKIIVEINPQAEFWITDSSTNLLEINAIDSLNIVDLISSLETKFDVVINSKDITTDNFINCESLLNLLKNNYNFNLT